MDSARFKLTVVHTWSLYPPREQSTNFLKVAHLILIFFLHLNANMDLWFLYCELLGHFLDNTCTLTRISEALKAKAHVIVIRDDLFNKEV